MNVGSYVASIMLNIVTGVLFRKRWPCSDGVRTSCLVRANILTCLGVIVVFIVNQPCGHVIGRVTYVAEAAFTFHAHRSVQDGSVIGASKSFSTGTNITNARI